MSGKKQEVSLHFVPSRSGNKKGFHQHLMKALYLYSADERIRTSTSVMDTRT